MWPYGRRTDHQLAHGFKPELDAITVEDEEPSPDGSPPMSESEGILVRRELMALMRRAGEGSVRTIEYDTVRDGDVVVELKFPRPPEAPTFRGWHYRLYAGVPERYPHNGTLVWAVASRKPDEEFCTDDEWRPIQTAHINTAQKRFKVWLISISSSAV